MRLFESSTTDFSDDELEQIKTRTEQLYLDVSRKSRFDDFAQDLERLTLAAECKRCAFVTECAGMFVKRQAASFAEEEAILRSILLGLRGIVLDYGCGHAPYADVLAAAAESGALQYHGVEPDDAARARLAQRRPWASLSSGVCDEPQRFDHLLLLRSINHLADPRSTIGGLLPRLKPGGTLIIVDNVAFGVVRSREQALRAEGSAAGFEHFRNASAEAIHELLADLPLRSLQRRDVTPTTANQWLLQYART
jgi:SAM-dependent methyltransferase